MADYLNLDALAITAGVLTLIICLGLIAYVIWTRAFVTLAEWFFRFLPGNLNRKLTEMVELGVLGLGSLRDVRLSFWIAVTSVLQWLLMGVMVFIALWSFDINAFMIVRNLDDRLPILVSARTSWSIRQTTPPVRMVSPFPMPGRTGCFRLREAACALPGRPVKIRKSLPMASMPSSPSFTCTHTATIRSRSLRITTWHQAPNSTSPIARE